MNNKYRYFEIKPNIFRITIDNHGVVNERSIEVLCWNSKTDYSFHFSDICLWALENIDIESLELVDDVDYFLTKEEYPIYYNYVHQEELMKEAVEKCINAAVANINKRQATLEKQVTFLYNYNKVANPLLLKASRGTNVAFSPRKVSKNNSRILYKGAAIRDSARLSSTKNSKDSKKKIGDLAYAK